MGWINDTFLSEGYKEVYIMRYLHFTSVNRMLIENLNSKRPFSLIRLGDGEYTVLKYKKWTTRARCLDRINRWFDAFKLSEKEVISIRNQILRACQGASLLGIASANELRYYSKWKSFESICKALKIPLINTFFFHDVLKLNYKEILKDRNVVCITCRDIEDKIKKNFAPATIKTILIRPEKFAWRSCFKGQDTRSDCKDHYHVQFEEIYKMIMSTSQKGVLYLIGAGGLGKSYCNLVKNQGGMGLDIGSLFDIWSGSQTRPYLKRGWILK